MAVGAAPRRQVSSEASGSGNSLCPARPPWLQEPREDPAQPLGTNPGAGKGHPGLGSFTAEGSTHPPKGMRPGQVPGSPQPL